MKRYVILIIIIFQAFFTIHTKSALSSVNDLDELFIRKSRHNTSFYSFEYIEGNASNHYIWQPETLCYTDVKTGREVWRMTNTNSVCNDYRNDIGVSVWSANGNRLGFVSDRNTSAFNRGDHDILMIVNANGMFLRPLPDAPARTYGHNPFFHWSPQVVDVYYEFGRELGNNYDLYKVVVSDTGVTKTLILSFPSDRGELFLNKTISADGKKVIAMPYNESWWYPATIYPDESAALDVADGYTVDRNMDDSWGDTPSSYLKLHDQYYFGDGTWIFVLIDGTHTWWRLKVLGTAPDGGSKYNFTPPTTFYEQWPENASDRFGGTNDPFGCEYWSHFVPDRWGRYALFSATQQSPNVGPGVWDIKKHETVVATFGGGAQHHDWHGFTDWIISTRGPSDTNYLDDRIYLAKYNDEESQETVCFTYTLFNNGGEYLGREYMALPRPSQSPDGTKAAFQSTFLNNKIGDYDNKPDIFWAVCYYPYPPEIIGGVKIDTKIRIAFDFRHSKDNPRTYTTRGWPDEVKDSPPLPKEITKFRIWDSEDRINWTQVALIDRSDEKTEWGCDVPQLSGTTRYYAVTSIEQSGLESHKLSNVWNVTLDENGNITKQAEDVAYPADPGGVSHFYTQKPLPPKNVAYAHKKASPVDKDGQYTIEWDEPENTTLIRYYNIYAEDGTVPVVDQSNRIGSIPKGWCQDEKCKWTDVFGNPDGTTRYTLTSVDYQGNESGTTAEGPLAAPNNPRVLPGH